jgi:hypothetical protein
MFIDDIEINKIMNKSILIGIPIAIIVILLGIFFVSSYTDFTKEPISEFEPQNESEPKRYTQTLSEAVGVNSP